MQMPSIINYFKDFTYEKTCMNYTRAYLHGIIGKEEVACHLISAHNIYYLLNLMKDFRQSILTETVEAFVA